MVRVPVFRFSYPHPNPTQEGGEVYSTAHVRRLVQRMAAACGEQPGAFGAKSFRVGGATDLRSVLGAAGKEVIKQRGRWHSDIAEIYQRTLLSEQVRGSAAMADARGADLESLLHGWSQPA